MLTAVLRYCAITPSDNKVKPPITNVATKLEVHPWGTVSVKKRWNNTQSEKMIVIEDCQVNKAVTILVKGGSTMIVDEARR